MKKKNEYIIDELLGIAKIELRREDGDNLWTIIDIDDLDRVISFPGVWYAKYQRLNNGYYVYANVYDDITKRTKTVLLHQFIMSANGNTVDHINHNTFDNRKTNLRIVNDSDNLKNRKGKNSNNTSGYRNVTWSKHDKKWIVQLQIDKRNKTLGWFDDVEEAGKFAEEMRQKYYGEFAGKS